MTEYNEIRFEELRGLEKAAILLNYLGEEGTKTLLKDLDDNEIRKVINYMTRVKTVPVIVTKKVLEEFYEKISESQNYIFSKELVTKDSIVKAVGEERARGILGHLNLTAGSRTLESLELVDAKSLANFLVNEYPQTIAVILAHLETEKKCEVLKNLPEAVQSEAVLRMANLDYISPELIEEIDKVLKQELAAMGTVEQAQLGGVTPVAEMLNIMDKNTESQIMARLEEKDPILAEEIRKLMFVFEDLVKIDDRGIQAMLKDIPNDKLLLALKTATQEVRDKILRNMSTRAATLLQEDLANMGPAKLSDVEAAQQEIVNIARKLEAEGKILIARGGGKDALV